jgi:hypothetical protein
LNLPPPLTGVDQLLRRRRARAERTGGRQDSRRSVRGSRISFTIELKCSSFRTRRFPVTDVDSLYLCSHA